MRRETNRERAMIERKCCVCRGFGHITYNCKNIKIRRKERSTLILSNKFEVLSSILMNRKISSRSEERKNRKKLLREEKLKKEKKD